MKNTLLCLDSQKKTKKTKKKQKKKKASFGFSGHIQGRFSAVSGIFRPFLACFGRRPIRPNMANTARFWPNQPGSARIEANLARIEPCRRESSQVGTNPRKKKKAQTRTDARATASNAGAAPLVPRPCFLEEHKSTNPEPNSNLKTQRTQ